jgi:Tol biopolymer transport system component
METSMKYIALLACGFALLAAPQKNDGPEQWLQNAMQAETVDGDLKTAIEQYKKIIARSGASRDVVAKALVRLGMCYQRQGNAEARKQFERVVRDYADQKESVAEARAKLGGAAAASPSSGDRPVWTGEADGFGSISPDGRFLTYTDWETGGLVLRNLSTGTDRRLTAGSYAEGQTQFSVISKDGKQVAFQWLPTGKKGYELRTASLLGTGILNSRLLLYNDDILGVQPYDWSADGKWLAVFVARQDRTGQIGVVSTTDGALRVLKSPTGVDWKGPTKIFFSPDSRYIAYDLKTDDTSRERRIFVMAIDGSRETAAVTHASGNAVMGWSPDGSYLLFGSDRSGSTALWGVPMADGKPRGPATLLKADIASSWSIGTTAAGALYVWKSTPVYVGVSAIDLNGGRPAASAASTSQIFIGSRGRPDWSRDGKELAYSSCVVLGGGPCTLLIRSMETGKTRELEPRLQYFFFPRFSPDGRSFITNGTDLKGRQGIYRIDAHTGEASIVMDAAIFPQWTADGKGIYCNRRDGTLGFRDLATGEERELLRGRPDFRGFSVSPDGKQVAVIASDLKTYYSLLVIPLQGGEPRTLLHVSPPETLSGDQARSPAWTPDGRAIVIAKGQSSLARITGLWSVPIDGSQARKLDIDTENWTGDGFRISPDGRQIAFVASAGAMRHEIWALENFLPNVPAKK